MGLKGQKMWNLTLWQQIRQLSKPNMHLIRKLLPMYEKGCLSREMQKDLDGSDPPGLSMNPEASGPGEELNIRSLFTL